MIRPASTSDQSFSVHFFFFFPTSRHTLGWASYFRNVTYL